MDTPYFLRVARWPLRGKTLNLHASCVTRFDHGGHVIANGGLDDKIGRLAEPILCSGWNDGCPDAMPGLLHRL